MADYKLKADFYVNGEWEECYALLRRGSWDDNCIIAAHKKWLRDGANNWRLEREILEMLGWDYEDCALTVPKERHYIADLYGRIQDGPTAALGFRERYA